jgi:hypothetical protein
MCPTADAGTTRSQALPAQRQEGTPAPTTTPGRAQPFPCFPGADNTVGASAGPGSLADYPAGISHEEIAQRPSRRVPASAQLSALADGPSRTATGAHRRK